jgi:hypothetical protein
MSKEKKPTNLVRYCGQGSYMIGLPARDMTLEEWQSYPEALRSAALEIGLYDDERSLNHKEVEQ